MDKKQLKKGKKKHFQVNRSLNSSILLKEKRWKKKVIVRGGKPSDQTWPRGLIFSLRALLCILKFGRGCPAQGVSAGVVCIWEAGLSLHCGAISLFVPRAQLRSTLSVPRTSHPAFLSFHPPSVFVPQNAFLWSQEDLNRNRDLRLFFKTNFHLGK